MTARFVLVVALLTLAKRSEAQGVVRHSDGEIARTAATTRVDAGRLVSGTPSISGELRARIRVSADSAQRIAMSDFDWKGRVGAVTIDEEDSRLYWDVKIVPDSIAGTVVRYRVDATNGGILSISEFTGIRGLVKKQK